MPDSGSSNWQQQITPNSHFDTDTMDNENTDYTEQDYINYEKDYPQEEEQDARGSSSKVLATDKPHVCNACGKDYRRECDLRKHEKNHEKPYHCGICPPEEWDGGAERKDLNRHMWSHHRDIAHKMGLPPDQKECPHCGQKSRSDNLKRHMKTCKGKKSKH